MCDHSVAGAITPCLGWKPIAAPTFLPHSCQQTAPAADVTIMLMYEVFSLLHANLNSIPSIIMEISPADLYLSNPQWSLLSLQSCSAAYYAVVLTSLHMCSALLQVEPWSWSPHTLHIPDQAPVPITTITLKP